MGDCYTIIMKGNDEIIRLPTPQIVPSSNLKLLLKIAHRNS